MNSLSRKKHPQIAVLIPCYNEASTIRKVILDYKKNLPKAKIYVYDNNSEDNTAKIAKKYGAIVKIEPRQGKGNVIRQMFRDIDADCYLMTDGDNTYPAKYASEMVKLVLRKNIDMVIGDRLSSTYFTQNKRPFHSIGNRLVCFLINFLFQSNIKDIMTGYRAFSRQFVKTFPVLSTGFELETEMTIHSLDKNLLIQEIPIIYKNRPKNSFSKLNTYQDGMRILKTIFSLYKDYKPLSFFTFISFILFLFSTILVVPVLQDYWRTGLVQRFPTLFVSGFLIIASLLTFCCGLILDVNAKKHRQLFEILLTQTP